MDSWGSGRTLTCVDFASYFTADFRYISQGTNDGRTRTTDGPVLGRPNAGGSGSTGGAQISLLFD